MENLCSCAQSVCCQCSVLGSWHVVGVNCYANSKVKHINEIKWPIFKRGFQRLRPFLWLSFHFPSALFAAVNFQMSFSTLKYPPSQTAAALECEGVARLAGRSLLLEESSDVTSLTLGRSLGISSCLSLKTAFNVYLQPTCSFRHRKPPLMFLHH